jgi:hypothetical protein
MATIAAEGKAAHGLTALHTTLRWPCGIVAKVARKYFTSAGVIG